MRMFGIDQNHRQRVFQNIENRLPVNSGAFNRHMRALDCYQPVPQLQQLSRHGRKGTLLLFAIRQNQTRHQHLGVHINTATHWMNDLHLRSYSPAGKASKRKILLYKFTRARNTIRWCLEKAFGSNSVSGSASSHRRQSLSISSPRWLELAYFKDQLFHVRWCASAHA